MKNNTQTIQRVFFNNKYNKYIVFISNLFVLPLILFIFSSIIFPPSLFAGQSARQSFGVYLTIAKPASVITNSDVNDKIIEKSTKGKKENNSLILISRDGLAPTFFTTKNISVTKIENFDQQIVHNVEISPRVFDNRIEIPSKKYFLFRLQVKPSSPGEKPAQNNTENMITFLYE